jgi:5-formyltetrahydrofolate cyclo-ligase
LEKERLRKKNKELRNSLSQEEREEYSLEIANQALGLDIWGFEFYHIFLPIERLLEINTQYLLSVLQGMDKNVVLSKSNFKSLEMHNYLLTDSTNIVVNKWGIPEPQGGIEIDPKKIEVVFVPLLAYDTLGNRLGYGKGFYDRFLAKCSKDVVKIGLSYFGPEKQIIPTKDTDVSMNYCISPKKAYSF